MTAGEHHEAAGDTDQRDDSPRDTLLDRREVLQAAAAGAAATGLAGCTGDSNKPTATGTPTRTRVVVDCSSKSFETLEQSDVNGGVTLKEGCYEINSVHTIDNGTLTLKPGVLIQFAQGAGLDVQQGGAIQSKGADYKRVVLKGKQHQRGHWQGLRFAGDGTNQNVLEHTHLFHAGSGLWAGSETDAAIYVKKAALEITGSVLRSNAGKTILARESEADLDISETEFQQNALPIRMHAELVGGFEESNFVGNNDDDRVTIHGRGSPNEISTNQKWGDPGVPFHVVEDLKVTAGLTILGGVTFDFGKNVGVDVDGGRLWVGSTDSDPARLRGDKSTRGYWQGIQFRNTTGVNIVANTVLKDAGGEQWSGSDYSQAGVFVNGDDVEVTLKHSTFSNNDVCGVTAHSTNKGYDFTVRACEFTGNAEPLRVSADLVKDVFSHNSFSGNDGSYVRVGFESSTATVRRSQTWAQLTIPYRLRQALKVTGDLEIEPGTTVEVIKKDPSKSNEKLNITVVPDEGGSLKADASGPEEETIVFTGVKKEPGHWGGIGFKTESSDNVLRNVDVEYGGGKQHAGDTNSKALVAVWASGLTTNVKKPRATLEDVTFRESANHGIYKQCDADLTCKNVTFDNISGHRRWDNKGQGSPVSDCSPTC